MARILTYPEQVNAINKEKLKKLVAQGPKVYPGACYFSKGDGSDRINLKFANRRMISQNLCIGDIVERHLQDDDIVLFNRQPSLHRISIMVHKYCCFVKLKLSKQ